MTDQINVPSGWVLVPETATMDMLMAGASDNTPRTATNSLDRMTESLGHIYRAMLTAAPTPGQTETAGGEGGWRPEVRAFADMMETKLRENDRKPGWKSDDPEDLLIRLGEEGAELRDAVSRWRSQINWGDLALHLPACVWHAGQEAVDIANFAMMIADVCGALKALPAAPGTHDAPAKDDTADQSFLAREELEKDLPTKPQGEGGGSVEPKRGEIRIIDGNCCRFIERELEGDKWEVLGPVAPSNTDALKAALRTLAEFRKRVREGLGEAVHVGLRKGTYGPGAHPAWKAISDCNQGEWGDAIKFAIYGLEYGLESDLKAADETLAALSSKGEGNE